MNEAALKDRLKAIAMQKNIALGKVWKQLLLERFLARLSNSLHQNKFIFKGGLLLAQYIKLNRETIDIDFLITKIKSEIRVVEKIIKEITAVNSEDGFSFSWFSSKELTQPHMRQSGFRVTLNVEFGKMKDKIQIDIGIGDAVSPTQMTLNLFEYKGKAIFPDEISLYVYPPETIFAEKFETIISKGATNSRIKDYHDLLMMIREPNFLETEKLLNSIQTTFDHRETPLSLTINFDYNEMQALQVLWSNHLYGLGINRESLNLPTQFSDAINEINGWLKLKTERRESVYLITN